MKLSVITITLNSGKFISEQTRSLARACGDIEFEHIIVDNGSRDDTVKIVDDVKNVKLIKNIDNVGFGLANNQGYAVSRGEFILFLNPDMKFTEAGILEKAIFWMNDNPEVGIMGCKLVDRNGMVNYHQGPRRFPKISEQIALILKLPHVFSRLFKKYHYHDLNLNEIQEVDTVRGSFVLVRREVIEKLGGRPFDKRYFVWFEEVDLCRQVQKLGYKIMYNPNFYCVDLVGKSFETMDPVWKQKQFTRSMLLYFQKWEPWYKWIWIMAVRPMGIALAYLNSLFRFKL